MGKKIKGKHGTLVMHNDVIRDLMKSEAIGQACLKEAQEIQQSAGEGYKTDLYLGPKRVNSSVTPQTSEAIRDTLQNNTLIKLADSHSKK